MGQFYKGQQADIFSIIVSIFFLYTGFPPFRIASIFDPSFNILIKKDKL